MTEFNKEIAVEREISGGSQVQIFCQESAESSRKQETRHKDRRSKFDTCCDILKVIGSGAHKPTHIMYKANLSWTNMQDYISSLSKAGLLNVREETNRTSYELTDKGFALLKEYLSIRETLMLEN